MVQTTDDHLVIPEKPLTQVKKSMNMKRVSRSLLIWFKDFTGWGILTLQAQYTEFKTGLKKKNKV